MSSKPDLLRTVAPDHEPDTRLSMAWISRPGVQLPVPGPPMDADPCDLEDEHAGWRAP